MRRFKKRRALQDRRNRAQEAAILEAMCEMAHLPTSSLLRIIGYSDGSYCKSELNAEEYHRASCSTDLAAARRMLQGITPPSLMSAHHLPTSSVPGLSR